MSLELIDIALAESQPHPTLAERMTGKVRAVLTETIGGQEIRHEIMMSVWVEGADRRPAGRGGAARWRHCGFVA